MPSILFFRNLVSSIIFNFFGFFCPSLASIKAILTKDVESVKEFLTYWTVLVVLMYIEMVLRWGYSADKYPPEIKVLFILWLTLPRFQGAYRIYLLVLKPYFEEHEANIDKHVAQVGGRVKTFALSHLQKIMWQLLMEPQEGLLANVISFVPIAPLMKTVQSFSTGAVSAEDTGSSLDDAGESNVATSAKASGGKRKKFDEEMLTQFQSLLATDGIFAATHLYAVESNETQHFDNSVMRVTQHTHANGSKSLCQIHVGHFPGTDRGSISCIDDSHTPLVVIPLYAVANCYTTIIWANQEDDDAMGDIQDKDYVGLILELKQQKKRERGLCNLSDYDDLQKLCVSHVAQQANSIPGLPGSDGMEEEEEQEDVLESLGYGLQLLIRSHKSHIKILLSGFCRCWTAAMKDKQSPAGSVQLAFGRWKGVLGRG